MAADQIPYLWSCRLWHVGQVVTKNKPGLCIGADLCQELDGIGNVTFSRVYAGSPPSRTIMTTERFAVIADLSPLTTGHLLLLPKVHFLSFAQVARHLPGDLDRMVGLVSSLYGQTFGTPVILEHGSARNDDHNACITHAHWHIVPANGPDIVDLMRDDGLRPTVLCDLASAPWPDTPYYLVSHGGTMHICPATFMPRQYVRSLIGRRLGMRDPEWDYALIVRRELLRETMTSTAWWQDRCDQRRP